MGIDFKKFEKASYENIQKSGLDSSELKKQINVHKLENRGKLILSIDRLDSKHMGDAVLGRNNAASDIMGCVEVDMLVLQKGK